MIKSAVALLAVVLACHSFGSRVQAQHVTIAAPRHSGGDSFYENFGVNFGFSYDSPNAQMFFRNTGGAPPFFGGFDPNAQSSFGFGGRSGPWSWDFGITGGQGSNRNYVTTTPILTLPSGGFGSLTDVTTRPFVTGIIPVVNDRVVQQQHLRKNFEKASLKVSAKKRQEQREYERLRAKVRAQAKSSSTGRGKKIDAPLVLGAADVAESKAEEKSPY